MVSVDATETIFDSLTNCVYGRLEDKWLSLTLRLIIVSDIKRVSFCVDDDLKYN